MTHLFEEPDVLKQRLKGNHLVLFLDYDGTLAPIAQTPDKAVLSGDIKIVLTGLSELPKCHLAVISGRKLSDLKKMIDIPGITFVGNHGFEIEGEPLNIENNLIPKQYQKDIAHIKNSMTEKLPEFQGVWIEDKGTILTVHFRQATQEVALSAKKAFTNIYQSYLDNQRVRVMEGKKVLEVRPPIKWDKGEAALLILSKWQQQLGKEQSLPIYVGDDFTDEDAFSVIKDLGITVYVGGQKSSHAQYYLNNTDEVIQFLEYLYEETGKP